MKKRWILLGVSLLAPTPAVAGGLDTLTVDADGCPKGSDAADGSDESPFCDLQAAFDSPELVPGVHIQVKQAETPYGAATASGPSGTPEAPIVIEPFPGHLPTIGGVLTLSDVAHWQVRRLTFVREGDGQITAANAVGIDANDTDDLVIAGNTLNELGIDIRGSDRARIDSNLVHGAAGSAIRVAWSDNVELSRNTVRQATCFEPIDNEVTRSSGLDISETDGVEIRGNRLVEFVATCDQTSAVALHQSTNAEVHRNFVRDVLGDEDHKMGVAIGAGSSDAYVHRNIIRDTGDCGVCVGRGYGSGGNRARIVANTIIGGGRASVEVFHEASEQNAPLVANNILLGPSDYNIDIRSGSIVFAEHNIYFGANAIGRCRGNDRDTIREWRGECGSEDPGSIYGDPEIEAADSLGSDDYTPRELAADAGLADDLLINSEGVVGDAPDIGALEPPVPLGATVDAGQPNVIELGVEGIEEQLDYVSGCEGFSVWVTPEEEPRLLDRCDWDGNRIDIALRMPLVEGETVDLHYEGGLLAHNTGIGGFIGAQMLPFTRVVDNMAPPSSDDTGSGGTTGPSEDESGDGSTLGDDDSGDSDGTNGTDGGGNGGDESSSGPGSTSGFPTDSGCGCRSSAPTSAWLLLGLVALARRRQRSDTVRGRGNDEGAVDIDDWAALGASDRGGGRRRHARR